MLIEVGFRGVIDSINVGGYGENLWQGALSAREIKRKERRRRMNRERIERKKRKIGEKYIPGLTVKEDTESNVEIHKTMA